MSDCTAVLLAAGRGTRLGFDKILTNLAGRPVVEYSLEALSQSPSIDRIILVTRPDLFEALGTIARKFSSLKPIEITEGGKERQDSVYNGIKKAPESSNYILIHDSARPLLTVEIIEKLLEECRKSGAVVRAQQATDTIKRATQEGNVVETLDRSEIWMMQTPQIFKRNLIADAYRHVVENNIPITDDASAVEITGHPVHLVDLGGFNLKITRQADWEFIELYLKRDKIASLREKFHTLNNQLGPLIGYTPLLEKYGSDHPKFQDYMSKVKNSTSEIQCCLHELQNLMREVAQDSKEG